MDHRQEFSSVQEAVSWAEGVTGESLLGIWPVVSSDPEGVVVESDLQVEGSPYVVKVSHPAGLLEVDEKYVLVMGEKNEGGEAGSDGEVGSRDPEGVSGFDEGFETGFGEPGL